MPQSLACIYLHIVFSTKHRQPLIRPEIEDELYKYISGILRQHHSPVIAINGVADHIHILCRLSRTITVSKLLEEVKKGSSKWIKSKGEAYRNFYWQNGYGAFSISQSHAERVIRYIARQKQHHGQADFQQEYRALLRKYELEYDERYAWD